MSDSLVYGRCASPGFYDRPIWKRENAGQNYLGDRVLRFMVLHRMIGTLDGTDSYFRFDYVNALTDWGVGTAFTDGAAKAGVIYRWNSVDTNQSGWASGPWERGSAKGVALVNKYGINAINRDGESIEVSGRKYTDPIDDETLEEIAELIAWRADSIQIPWSVFPLNPHTGLPFVYNHSDFQAHKPCAGDVLLAKQDAIVARAKEIMRMAQGGGIGNQPGPVVPAPPVVFVSFPKPVVMHLIPGSVSRQYANRSAKQIKQYKARTAVKVGGYYLGEDVNGEKRWPVVISRGISNNARVHASGFEEDIPTFSAATKVIAQKGTDQNKV